MVVQEMVSEQYGNHPLITIIISMNSDIITALLIWKTSDVDRR